MLMPASGELLESIQGAGNLAAVASVSGTPVSGRHVRSGRDVCNMVVVVTPQHSAMITQQVRSTGVVVQPYLTSIGCAVHNEQL